MNTQRRLLTSALVVILALAGTLTQASPNLMSYHGRLSDSEGDPVADGPYNVTFRVYDDPIGGAILWAELQSITTLDGLFATQLGKTTPLAESVFSGDARWIGVQIDTDPELSPRAQLTSAPYSHRVSTVDGAKAGTVTGDLTVDGEVNIIGPGLRFPDGTLQSTAASTFNPFEGLFNNYTEFSSGAVPASIVAFTAPADSSVFVTSISSQQVCVSALDINVGGSTILRLGPSTIAGNCRYDWHSHGGAPIVVPAGQSLELEKIGAVGGYTYRVTITGYKR